MNISLTPELEQYVHEKVNRGMYTSASEVIRESLRLMHTYDDLQKSRIAELNLAIESGLKSLDNRQPVDGQTSRKKMKNKIDAIGNKKQ